MVEPRRQSLLARPFGWTIRKLRLHCPASRNREGLTNEDLAPGVATSWTGLTEATWRLTMSYMKTSMLTIRLDDDLAKLLDQASKRSGRSRSEVAREALRRQLRLVEFESLRKKAMPFAEARGYLTDERCILRHVLMRIFLDTNVLVSAFTTRGLCEDVLREVLSSHDLIVSFQLFEELERTLTGKFGMPIALVSDIVALVKEVWNLC